MLKTLLAIILIVFSFSACENAKFENPVSDQQQVTQHLEKPVYAVTPFPIYQRFYKMHSTYEVTGYKIHFIINANEYKDYSNFFVLFEYNNYATMLAYIDKPKSNDFSMPCGTPEVTNATIYGIPPYY